ncbi:MAG TPA: cytochrome c [Caulobacteraceae bacterium]|nr:cytochrome c [Caulobacteraceae bacterium]
MRSRFAAVLAALACASCVSPHGAPNTPPDRSAVARGAVLAAAGDCRGCHTDIKGKGAELAGGPALATQFGSFYAPNITFDKTAGIGDWSEADFRRAMRQGKGAHGEYLYPVFPYAAFTGMTDQDISDLYAYLRAQPTSANATPHNAIPFPFNIRPTLAFWRLMFFHKGPLKPVAGQSAEWNRGRYLAEAVAHCQECHTPRNVLGGLDNGRAYAGEPHGPDNQRAPNITPGGWTKSWSADDVAEMLDSGMEPDGDYVGGSMATVVEGTTKLSLADRKAIGVYMKSLAAKPSAPSAKPG